MTDITPSSVFKPRETVAKKLTSAAATFEKAVELARSMDVDAFDFVRIDWAKGNDRLEDELLAPLKEAAIKSDIRFDYIINGEVRFTKIGNRH